MANPLDPLGVEALLEETARQVERDQERKANSDTREAREADNRRDDRQNHRDRHSDRYDRYDRHDRYDDRDRRDRDRGRESHRESNGDRRKSRERERRRREGSRPRSSKDADTDEEHDRYRRSSSRERHRHRRGDDRRGGGDFYSGSGRVRSRSPRRDREDRYRDRGREDRRDRDRSRERRRSGDDHRSGAGSRRDRTRTPEVTEDDRDKRTIFVQQISARAEVKSLRRFFEAVGPVVEAQIVKDRVTGRSKGVGYVEFKDEESVPKALELTGQKLKGIPIIAQLAEAEKNRASRASEGAVAPGGSGAPFHRLYVGNIHFSVTEADLKDIFEPFGKLEEITLQRDEMNPGRSKGYGFVQYEDPANAKMALGEMNGFELAGRQIRVGLGNDKFTPESTANLLRSFNQQAQTYQGSAFSGAGGRGVYAGGSGGVFDRAHGKDDRGISGASALDDTDVAGVNFKTYDRVKLMESLARRPEPEATNNGAAQVVVAPRPPVVNTPQSSRCIKIENGFDVEHELRTVGDDWFEGLQDDVKEECTNRYGTVIHVAADANSDGDIYVKFKEVASGERAIQGLQGRTFNHRIIRASYVVEKFYDSMYAEAAKL